MMISSQRQHYVTALRPIPEEQSVQEFHGNNDNFYSSYKPPPISRNAAAAKKENQVNAYFLVNQARLCYNLHPLHRCPQLDAMARAHAQRMTQYQAVFHSVNSPQELRQKLNSFHVGENNFRGRSVLEIHNKTMANADSFLRSNILSSSFQEMGMGTAIDVDGVIYLVQLFR